MDRSYYCKELYSYYWLSLYTLSPLYILNVIKVVLMAAWEYFLIWFNDCFMMKRMSFFFLFFFVMCLMIMIVLHLWSAYSQTLHFLIFCVKHVNVKLSYFYSHLTFQFLFLDPASLWQGITCHWSVSLIVLRHLGSGWWKVSWHQVYRKPATYTRIIKYCILYFYCISPKSVSYLHC